MSISHNILIRWKGSTKSFVDEAASALGLQFRPTARYVGGEGVWAVAGEYGVGILRADFDEPLDVYSVRVEIAADEDEEKHARVVFEALKALGAAMTLFAHDIDIELERFAPPAS